MTPLLKMIQSESNRQPPSLATRQSVDANSHFISLLYKILAALLGVIKREERSVIQREKCNSHLKEILKVSI